MPARVALVEDNPVYRNRFIERFRFFDDIELVFAAASGEECLERLAGLGADRLPQVILMDIELPAMSGIETTAAVRARYPDVEAIMLTVFENEDRIFASLQAGASGYLLKDASADVIVGSILELLQGGAPMSPAVARKMLAYVRQQESAAVPAPKQAAQAAFDLTDREREVLEYLIADETEQCIAERFGISPHTVRSHVKNIYEKLHVHSRASAVRVALRHRLLG